MRQSVEKPVGTSFRNIGLHIRVAQRDAIAEAESVQTVGQRHLQFDYFSKETVDIYHWIDQLVTSHQPSSRRQTFN